MSASPMFSTERNKAPPEIDLAGAFILGNWVWLAKLSHSPEGVSVWGFLLLMALAWLGVIWTWFWLRGAEVDARALLIRLWFWAVLFRLAGFVGEPVLENDYFRYLWDGRQFALSGNPYASAPIDHFADAGLPDRFQEILDNINYPEVPTIYGPVTEVAFLVSYWISPGHLWPLKLLLLLADLLTIRFLLDLTTVRNVFLYAWCPLLIKETIFTAHADSLGILLLVAGFHASVRGRFARLAVLSGLAVGAKILATLLVPFLLCRSGRRYWAPFVATLAAVYLPFWLQGSAADLAGLKAFLSEWEFNSSVSGILAWLVGATVGKLVCGVFFSAAWIAYFTHWRSRMPDALPRGDWIYGVFFILSATVNAWYLLWLLPFVAIFPSLTGVTFLAAVSLAYISRSNLGDGTLFAGHPSWVRPLEYGAILIALLIDWRRRHGRAGSAAPASRLEPETVGAPSSLFLKRTLVLIPALNEADCIERTVSFWRQLGSSAVRVVDNGSTDLTGVLAKAAGAEVIFEPKRGYGAAAWRGLQEIPTGIDWILFSSADGSDRLNTADLINWQRHLDDGAQLILGDRIGLSQTRENLKPIQQFGNWLCCSLIALGWGRRFKDLGSLRLIQRSSLDQLRLADRGFGWNVEMQVRAVEHGLHIVELQVGYYPRRAGQSKISGSFRGTLRAGRDMLATLVRLWITRQESVQRRRLFGRSRHKPRGKSIG